MPFHQSRPKQLCACFGEATSASTAAMVAADDGISPSMVRCAQLLLRLMA